jgi:hypothetical protein
MVELFHRGTFDVLVDGKSVGSLESDGDTIETPVTPCVTRCKSANADTQAGISHLR